MTPLDPTSLEPEEHALARRLARVGPHGEPSPALDSRILAAAHAAVAGHRGASRGRRRRWPLGLGVAASLALALGLAWQLRPLPQVAPAYRSEADSALRTAPVAATSAGTDTQAAAPPTATGTDERVQPEVAAIDLPQPARTGSTSVAAAKPAPLPAPPPAPPAPLEPQIVFDAPASTQAAPAPEAAKQAMPAAPARNSAAEAAATAAPTAAPQAFGTARTAAEADGVAPAASTPMPPAPARQKLPASAAAPAPPPASAASEDMPLEDIPPATVASPQVRDAWLARIRELAAAGRSDDARASLREFRHRYPDYPLPEDLRALLP